MGGSGGQGSYGEGSCDGVLRSGGIHVHVLTALVHFATTHVPVWIGEFDVETLIVIGAAGSHLSALNLHVVLDPKSPHPLLVFAIDYLLGLVGHLD